MELLEGGVQRMSGLIKDILDLSKARLGGGLSVFKRSEPNLASKIGQVISEMESGSGRSITTHFDLPDPVFVDSARLTQLLSSLFGNALTHDASDKPAARYNDCCLSAETNIQVFITGRENPLRYYHWENGERGAKLATSRTDTKEWAEHYGVEILKLARPLEKQVFDYRNQ